MLGRGARESETALTGTYMAATVAMLLKPRIIGRQRYSSTEAGVK